MAGYTYKYNIYTGLPDMVPKTIPGVTGPTVTLTSADAIDYEICDVVDIDLTASYIKRTNNVVELKFKRDGATIDTQAAGPGSGTGTYTDAGLTATAASTFWYTATIKDSAGLIGTSNILRVRFLNRIYRGADAGLTLDEAGILGLANSDLRASRVGDYTYLADIGKYKYICYPQSFGLLNLVPGSGYSVVDANDNPVPVTLAGTVNIVTSCATVPYYVYRSVNVVGGADTRTLRN